MRLSTLYKFPMNPIFRGMSGELSMTFGSVSSNVWLWLKLSLILARARTWKRTSMAKVGGISIANSHLTLEFYSEKRGREFAHSNSEPSGRQP